MSKNDQSMVKAPPTAITSYGDWSPEQMEEESREMAGSGVYWKVPDGRSVVRVLPQKAEWGKSPFLIQHQHFITLPGIPHKIVFCCPKQHEAKTCLACSKAAQLESSSNARDRRAADGLKPNKRVMANVVVNPKDARSSVQVWTFGKQVYDQLRAIRENPDAGGNFLDPHRGFNLSVRRTGVDLSTKYAISAARESTPLANMEWLEIQTDLRRLVRIPSVQQQERLFDGEDPRDVWGSDDDDARPAPSQTRRATRDDVIDTQADERNTAEDDLFDDEVDVD